jgi:hypothetical protein
VPPQDNIGSGVIWDSNYTTAIILRTLKVSHEMVNLDYFNCRLHDGYAERQGVGEIHKNLPASWALLGHSRGMESARK